MKRLSYLMLTLIYCVLLTGCISITPQNLNFDSAKMMEKGSLETQVNGSIYPEFDQINIGAKVGVGISNNYSVKLRYEAMVGYTTTQLNWQHVELDNKIGITKWFAASLPIGWYGSKLIDANNGSNYQPQYYREHWLELKPALYFTATFNEHIDLSVIPKGHFLFKGSDNLQYFGISVGAGFGKNLNKWAIRPEFGWDQLSNFSGGIGFSYYIKSKKEK